MNDARAAPSLQDGRTFRAQCVDCQTKLLRRRDVVAMLASAAVAFPSARAEPQRSKRVGVLISIAEDDEEGRTRVAAFQDALAKPGGTAARNHIDFEVRWGNGDADTIQQAAKELAALNLDVVLASGTAVVRALQAESLTAPIVFVQVADPVGAGMVASLEHPGGNITGFTNFNDAMGRQWLELLKETAEVKRAVILRNPAGASAARMLHAIEVAAPQLGVELNPVSTVEAADIRRAIAAFARQPNVGLIALPDATVTVHRNLIIALAADYQLPAVYPYRFFAASGGLMSYGVDTIAVYRRAATYVHRILRGEQSGKLPVQEPGKFELIVNLATARALGLTVAPGLLARADHVIS